MSLASIEKILGGKKNLDQKIKNRMDLVVISKNGVTKASLLKLADYLKLSVKEISKLLPVGERTIQRYDKGHSFKTTVSEHILQIAEVAARGEDVFGNRERFLKWVNFPCSALGNKIPLELLASRFGAEIVLDELGRIEHGIIP
ncbi:MAG: hypothetical protein APR63_10405 [Desulfuromonas sp. SDB]|nr:MAG: hypothetical protein APR63_10405 [Desulfuromonas sp. SDB]